MAVSGVAMVMKWIFVILNIPILIAGAISIGLGSWGLASEYGAEPLRQLTGSNLYLGAAIAIIVGGSVLVVISFVGILGAILENRWLLGFYFVIMLLLLILYVTVAAVGFAFRDELEEELNRQMENGLINNYMVDIDNNDYNYETANVWDKIQKKLDCCGVSGGIDSPKSWFLWQSSKWFKNQGGDPKDRNLVPSSCCVSEANDPQCQKAINEPSQPPQLNYYNTTKINPALNHKGCLTQLEDKIFNRTVAIAGIAVAILIVMLFCVLLSVCVCSSIRKSKGDVM